MSDEFDHNPENNYSTFWPLLILMIGLLIWSGYQVFAANSQRDLYAKQFQTAIPTITERPERINRYVALMKDLVETSAKDPVAAQIVKDAIQAGLIHVQPNATNAAGTPAAPTPAPSK